MPHPVADLFRKVAQLNLEDPRRQGNIVHLDGGPQDHLLVVGDIHGHRRNLQRVLAAVDLPTHPHRRIVLQEIVHGPAEPTSGKDRSIELLMRVARLKSQHPDQVLMILANHDLAEITGNEITKEGRGCCETFREGVEYAFGGQDTDEILQAMREMLLSQPMAILTAGRTFISHTLPSPQRMDQAGTEILHRPYAEDDLQRGGPVYEWVWGRSQSPEQLDQLAQMLGANFFVIAHTHVEGGAQPLGPRAMVITCDHDQGQVVWLPVAQALDEQSAKDSARPVVGLKGSLQP